MLFLRLKMAFSPFEVDVNGREVTKALVVAPVIVVLYEGANLRFQISRRVVSFAKDGVLCYSAWAFGLCAMADTEWKVATLRWKKTCAQIEAENATN